MSPAPAPASALRGCYVISLRPVGGHGGLRRAAAAHGARVIALSPWRLAMRDDAATRRALRAALRAPRTIFTSPAAVAAAGALLPLAPRADQQRLAVGASTAAALRRAGVPAPLHPPRMDSEGLLRLPALALAAIADTEVGLVTAPEGRARLAAALRRRGARILRADVYARRPVPPSAAALARLRALPASTPLLLPLSSGQALALCLDRLPADLLPRLLRARVVAASERLAACARGHGFDDIVQADDARPATLLAAAGRGRS